MADGTKIEWSEATWNPITGCSRISPGCGGPGPHGGCYAEQLAGTRLRNHPSRDGLTKPTPNGPRWTGEVRFNVEWLTQPMRWKRPRTIFPCAHGDLFHEKVPDEWIDAVFAVMALSPQHIFQVLTKRAARMQVYLQRIEALKARERIAFFLETEAKLAGLGITELRGHDLRAGFPLENVWCGVSAEDQPYADERLAHLRETPAAVRWVSAEPLLGPIKADLTGIDWMVVGGESGPRARPMHPDWARSLRDQCEAANVAFFFKQWGEWLPWKSHVGPFWEAQNGEYADGHSLFPADIDQDPKWDDGLAEIDEGFEHFAFQRVGKKAAGRLLDGVEHNAFPLALANHKELANA